MARHDSETLTLGQGWEGRVSGHVLKLAREAAGLSQGKLAEDCTVALTTVQGWESGRRPLTAVTAGQLASIRLKLRRHGTPAALLDAFPLALETDLFIGGALTSRH